MPSASLQRWQTERSAVLDEIERAHKHVRGVGSGVRIAIQQINQAYALLLSAQFQAYCRDLYRESVDAFVRPLGRSDFQDVVRESLLIHRKLVQGNPNPGNIGADFNRLKLFFWNEVAADTKNHARRDLLTELNDWRNAIAHQDYSPSMTTAGQLQFPLSRVRAWRSACDGLARSFDDVMNRHLFTLLGTPPW